MTALVVPQLSLSMDEAKVSRWLVDDGDAVAAGQPVVEIETDKATVEIEAPAAGVLRIVAGEGAIVAVEGVLAELDARAATDTGEPRDGADASASPAAAVARSVPATDGEPRRSAPFASPAARRIARERGIELAAVRGSGPGGRIVVRDVAATTSEDDRGVAPPAATDRLRQAIVGNITASWQQIPHVHVGGELVAGGVMLARAAGSLDADTTVTDLLVVALARALTEVPELNAVRRPDGSVERSAGVHLSIAVATPNGVVAPVLRDAASLTLREVTRERRRLVEAAREGTLDGHDLAGGTCTLSNLGAHPVDFFAPIVSGPQVAMVATGRVAPRPVAVDGLLGVRTTMWVNVAIDHRAADGEAGGRLLAAFEHEIARLPGGTA